MYKIFNCRPPRLNMDVLRNELHKAELITKLQVIHIYIYIYIYI